MSGSDLFVTDNGNGTIGEFSTSGATINATLVSGLSGPRGIVVAVPEPAQAATGLGILAFAAAFGMSAYQRRKGASAAAQS